MKPNRKIFIIGHKIREIISHIENKDAENRLRRVDLVDQTMSELG